MTPHEPTILVIDESEDRGRMIEAGLIEGGYRKVSRITHLRGMAAEIETRDPDVIVMDLGNPQRDFLEHMFRLSRAIRKPIAMFVDQSSDEATLEAIEAGVSAYVVDGLRKDRVKPILDLAVARFKSFEKLRHERDTALAALEDRKAIEKAKGLLMALCSVSENEAYGQLRREAMRLSTTMATVALEVIAKLEPTSIKEGKSR